MNTCTDSSENVAYMLLNLVAEAGEVAGKVAKAIRKKEARISSNALVADLSQPNANTFELERAVRSELGDVLWQVAGLAYVMGWSLEEVAERNISKLADRQERGVICGEGDNR